MKTPSLKTVAAAIGVHLRRSGDITGKLGTASVIAFCGATWKRRSLQSVRLYHGIRSAATPINETVATGKRLSAAIGFPVDVEAGKMLMTVQPDGSVTRHPCRHVVKPSGIIP